ncbi:MAG: hypothetical protein SWE60_20310 [Thermodesulfobacteriota bacterium]|nr:hypothetical protein [Thermodesulfobacteriota bacterium]
MIVSSFVIQIVLPHHLKCALMEQVTMPIEPSPWQDFGELSRVATGNALAYSVHTPSPNLLLSMLETELNC